MRVFAFVALDVSERDGFDYVDLRFDSLGGLAGLVCGK